MFKKLFGWGKKEEKKEIEPQIIHEDNIEDMELLSEEIIQETFDNVEDNLTTNEITDEPTDESTDESRDEPTDEQTNEQTNEEYIVKDDIWSQKNNIENNVKNIENNVEEEHKYEEDTPKGFFARLKVGLSKTTKNFTEKLTEMFECYEGVSELVYEDLEEILIMADVGFDTTNYIVENLRKRVLEKTISDTILVKRELQQIISEILSKKSSVMNINDGPSVITIVGVNGVGKTTAIGKLANKYKHSGKKVILAAADTFRAAAVDQLDVWAKRAGVEIVKHGEGADPSAVIFDGIKAAKSRSADILICDTAGRLHNKKNLMLELEKIFRIIDREYVEANKEVLLVIDATTGQNAISQAKLFKEVAPITGIILTKLDGTAKGGVVLGIIQDLDLPVKYIGVGEQINDLQEFDPIMFAKALFGEE